MFLLQGRSTPTESPDDQTTQLVDASSRGATTDAGGLPEEVRPLPAAGSVAPAGEKPARKLDSEPLLIAMLLDPTSDSSSRFWRHSATLSAGMHLRDLATDLSLDIDESAAAAIAAEPNLPPSEIITPRGQDLERETTGGVTRDELLRELLDERFGSIL